MADNTSIYVFHEGGGLDGTSWYNVSPDGVNWNGDTQIPNTNMSNGPNAVLFNDQIYVFHAGVGPDDWTLWYNVSPDGFNWKGDTKIPNTGINANPSVVLFNDQIYVFHTGTDGISLWYNVSSDGVNWKGDTQVPNTNVSYGPSAIVPMANYQNLSLSDVLTAFNKVPANGTFFKNFETDDITIYPDPHIQGMSYYKNYVLFTHSAHDDPGYFAIGNFSTGDIQKYNITTPDNYHHPSGFQVIGDYAALGIEPSEPDNSKAVVYFYDLTTISGSNAPKKLGPTKLPSPELTLTTHGAACTGIAYVGSVYIMAVYATKDGLVHIYQSNQKLLGDPDLSFSDTELFSFQTQDVDGNNQGYDNLALVTDISQNLYMIGLRGDSASWHSPIVDSADLIQIPLSQPYPTTLIATATRHMITDNPIAAIGPHFRYGSGVKVVSSDSLLFCCSGRRFEPSGTLMNKFYAAPSST